jgi:hypothetical protein
MSPKKWVVAGDPEGVSFSTRVWVKMISPKQLDRFSMSFLAKNAQLCFGCIFPTRNLSCFGDQKHKNIPTYGAELMVGVISGSLAGHLPSTAAASIAPKWMSSMFAALPR